MDYAFAARGLNPDIILSIPDLVYTERISRRRMDKMTQRTGTWLETMTGLPQTGDGMIDGSPDSQLRVFAPILPMSLNLQRDYIENVARNASVSGLTIYERYSASELSLLPERLQQMPVFSAAEPLTPHEVLDMIAEGIDLFALPFLHQATDAGYYFHFQYGQSASNESKIQPLALNFWEPIETPTAEPLSVTTSNCQCQTCTRHSRVYIHHLLCAKEMLGWTLLARHNIHTLGLFFDAVRASIGQKTFVPDSEAFVQRYAPTWPESKVPQDELIGEIEEFDLSATNMRNRGASTVGTGQGPRNRGYQSTTRLGERSTPLRIPSDDPTIIESEKTKLNQKAWEALPTLKGLDSVDINQ
jgi:queuine tRNA-ribosyltransferase subunit QTRTD1